MAWLRRHGLSTVLITLFLSMVTTTAFMANEMYRAQGIQESPIWRWWMFQTILSLEADVFGAILLVVLTKYLREKGSAEDKGK